MKFIQGGELARTFIHMMVGLIQLIRSRMKSPPK